MTNVAAEHIKDVLISKYADGNPQKAVEFIEIEQKAANGVIVSYDPSVHMVGAENRESVTCYLDSLLFAMFSKLDAFECMLKNDFPREDARYRLVSLLRIWVNMLRSGKLVRTDLVRFSALTYSYKADWADETDTRGPCRLRLVGRQRARAAGYFRSLRFSHRNTTAAFVVAAGGSLPSRQKGRR